MPYINLKTTKTVAPEKCEAIKAAFGKAIEAPQVAPESTATSEGKE